MGPTGGTAEGAPAVVLSPTFEAVRVLSGLGQATYLSRRGSTCLNAMCNSATREGLRPLSRDEVGDSVVVPVIPELLKRPDRRAKVHSLRRCRWFNVDEPNRS